MNLEKEIKKPFNNAKNVFCVINFNQNEKEVLEALSNAPRFGCDDEPSTAFILHDKDTDENGELKTAHCHLLICASKGQSKANWIDSICLALSVSRECVSVAPALSVRGCLRYRLHRHNKEKYQYKEEAVQGNMARALSEALVDKPQSNPAIDDLLACADDPVALYNLVGAQGFKRCTDIIHAVQVHEEIRIYEESNARKAMRVIRRVLDAHQSEHTWISKDELVDALNEACDILQMRLADTLDEEDTLF